MQHSKNSHARAYAALKQLIQALQAQGGTVSQKWLEQFIRTANEGVQDTRLHVKKKQLMPVFLAHEAEFDLSADTRQQLVALLQAKPRRTASGVATITVLTKPWPCQGNCAFCPNDLKMPKSYLANEPACQRAKANFFDPYLQVQSRLVMLESMGHPVDKIELIVLGGTFSDYPQAYQRWFVYGLFCALNDASDVSAAKARELTQQYRALFERHARDVDALQARVNAHELSYNQAVAKLPWPNAMERSVSEAKLRKAHAQNERAQHRSVGLSFETRPNAVTKEELTRLRALGATKIQIGVQSTRDGLLALSDRSVNQHDIHEAFALLRLFGFKIQAHFMLNLPGRKLEEELEDYVTFVSDPRYLPDEIKLYPTSLIGGTQLERVWLERTYRPYSTEELVSLLVQDLMATPCYVRVSRVIRDFSATDILAGNKLGNLRQTVEAAIQKEALHLQEIRFREVALADDDAQQTTLSTFVYHTSVSEEHFLQLLDQNGHIHGFLRLSLPTNHTHAMIRELHIYGKTAKLGEAGHASQHRGLGTELLRVAELIAHEHNRFQLYVISAVGTREYYRKRGFQDAELYLVKPLANTTNSK